MKIIVTGASGFVGRIIAEGLQANGNHTIIALYRNKPPEMCENGVLWLKNDLAREIPLVGDADYIVHCAAVHNFQEMSLQEFIDINLAMMGNVILCAKRAGVKGIVFTSSIDIYGEVKSKFVDEKTDRINPTIYGVSKYLCECMLQDCQNILPSVSLRLCGIVGPGAKKGWIAKVLAQAVCGEEIGIVNENGWFNNVVHTDDLLQFLLTLISNGFYGFNAFPVASKNSVTIKDAVIEIIKVTGSCSKIINNGLSANSFVIGNELAINYFNYGPADVLANIIKYANEACRHSVCSETE